MPGEFHRLPVSLKGARPGREHILAVLRDTDWVLGGPKGAAPRLGMKRSTLHWKMKKLDISFIVLCNRTDLDPEELARQIADLYLTPLK